MTTDIKKLLENSAIAAGIPISGYYDESDGFHVFYTQAERKNMTICCDDIWFWNPATNSGDSRDLQVKLKISLKPYDQGWLAYKFIKKFKCIEYLDADPNMAVLLVASAIGAAMKEGGE